MTTPVVVVDGIIDDQTVGMFFLRFWVFSPAFTTQFRKKLGFRL
jgi:hypothetical protein